MKKISLFILLCFVVQVLISQPVLNSNLNFEIGDTYRIDTYLDVDNIDPGAVGANAVWDFSQINGGNYIEGVNTVCVDPSITPFSDSVAVSESDVCTRDADNPAVGVFSYYQCSNNSRNYMAMGFLQSGNNNYTTYSDAQKYLEYPFSYGSNFTDSYDLLAYHIDMGYYFMRDSAEVSVVADSYGTITTPVGTYSNVLRIKRTTVDYFWYKYAPELPWVFTGEFTTIEYEWYAPNIKVPVFVITEEDIALTYRVRYLADYNFATGIKTIPEKDIKIYPVPAHDVITVSLKDQIEFEEYFIYSASGKLLMNKPLSSSSIDVGILQQGIYVLELKGSNIIARKKLIIN